MKTLIDRLRELSTEELKAKIFYQKKELEILKRDLETMERVIFEKMIQDNTEGK